jgi:hypothetical protein
MQRLEVSSAVRPIYGSLGAKGFRLSSATVAVTVNKNKEKSALNYMEVTALLSHMQFLSGSPLFML